MSDLTVKIAHAPGPIRREMNGYVWDEAGGFVAEVDIATAAECLTYPRPDFRLAEAPSAAARRALADRLGVKPENIVVPDRPARDEPTVSNIAGGKRAPELAALGFTRAGHLAALDAEGIERLASAIGAGRDEVRAWVEQAKQ
jgi:hypothetical protein